MSLLPVTSSQAVLIFSFRALQDPVMRDLFADLGLELPQETYRFDWEVF